MGTTIRVVSGWRIGAAMIAAAGLAMAAGAARAQPWVLHTVIEPPVLPDVDPADQMAFGSAVSVGAVPWLVVGATRADCAAVSGGGVVTDAGRIFIYRRVSGVWQFRQSFCSSAPLQDARYGSSVDIGDSWMIVGAPGATVNSSGRVELFRLDAATQQWSRQLGVVGASSGHLGHGVAIDGSLAVAGEPGYNGARGRLRSWKLSGSTITAQPHYAPLGLFENDNFGYRVGLHSDGCELPACTSYTDVVAGLSNSRVYVAKRTTTGWQSSQSIVPPVGARFAGALDLGHHQVVASLVVDTASPAIGCPVGDAVRVYFRTGGSFASVGDVCQVPTNELPFGTAVAVERGTSAFFVSSPDTGALGSTPLTQPGSVGMFDAHPPVTFIESVQELGLAPTGPAGIDRYNDAFGASVSQFSSYLAVGAPWSHVYFGTPGIGYVAIYKDCC